jgi:hypothetical protein
MTLRGNGGLTASSASVSVSDPDPDPVAVSDPDPDPDPVADDRWPMTDDRGRIADGATTLLVRRWVARGGPEGRA